MAQAHSSGSWAHCGTLRVHVSLPLNRLGWWPCLHLHWGRISQTVAVAESRDVLVEASELL